VIWLALPYLQGLIPSNIFVDLYSGKSGPETLNGLPVDIS
jgi:hypothetical protein